MFVWLLIIILAYFFFALSYLGDKLILSGPPKANAYTFYVGAISIFAVVFIPFIKFGFPDRVSLVWIIADALVFLLGMYAMFSALEKFDVSKVMTTIGATQPIFVFILTWLFWEGMVLAQKDIAAFLMLLLGSVIISWQRNSETTKRYLKVTLISSLLFSFDYIFSKIVYQHQPFLQGFVWVRLFVFIFSLAFLIKTAARREILKKQNFTDKKQNALFAAAHISGGIGNTLQGFAISLAPVAFLPILNSLRGVQYVFLFLIAFFLSAFFPKILKEEISKGAVARKIIAILLIMAGLFILVA